MCNAYGVDNCWIPVKGSNIVYNDPKDPNTGAPLAGLYCPAYSPTAIDGKGGFDGEVGLYEPICKIGNMDIHGPVFYNANGSKNCGGNFGDGFGGVSYNTLTGIINPTPIETRTIPAQPGKYLQSAVTLDDGKTYKINRGYMVDATLPSCSVMCKAYTQRNQLTGQEITSISNGEITIDNERYCYCGFLVDFRFFSHRMQFFPSYAVKPINNASPYVKSLTCTSKILISGD